MEFKWYRKQSNLRISSYQRYSRRLCPLKNQFALALNLALMALNLALIMKFY